ncbi:glutathione S-transferase family protein [Candidatus Peregrinibacteria bacterium]|nr:glutathione S-transferase family protein [Candidatus Peregrinibacteria bacterium]
MIKIYGPKMSSAARNHWMLAELGQEYEHVQMDMRAKDHKKPEFLELNPTGQVPVMVDGDVVLFESMAINEYLGLKFKPEMLGETIVEKANALKWSIWSYLNIQKYFGTIAYQTLWATEKDQSAIDKATAEVAPFLAILDKHLEGKTFLLGDKFTVADINAGVAVGYGAMTGFDFTSYPNLAKWFGTLSSRPAFIKANKEQ